MDLTIAGLAILVFVSTAIICRGAYIKGIQISEDAKTMRSRANAQERSNQAKMDGIFQVKLAEIGNMPGLEPNSEIAQILSLIPMMKNGGGSSVTSPPPNSDVISWDVLKEQLKNPEVKKVLLEHQSEAIQILRS